MNLNPFQITSKLVFATLVAVIGSSFQFGYNTGVINVPQELIQQFVNTTYVKRNGEYPEANLVKTLYGVMVSLFAIGGMIGSFAAGYVADWLGRKKSMFFNNILAIVAVVFMATTKYAEYYELLIVGRVLIGINAGINTGLAPLYLTEIAPISLRGALGIMNQIGIVTAILLSQVLGLPALLGSESLWPWLFFVPAIFAFFQLVCLPFCPDTPVYLLKTDNIDAAEKSLRWLRCRDDIRDELNQFQSELEGSEVEPNVGMLSLLKEAHLFKPLIIALVLQLAQQFSGINAIFYYSTELFVAAGLNRLNSSYATVGVGGVNVIVSSISAVLVEKYGRRILMLCGLGGMFFQSLLLSITLVLADQASWLTKLSIVAVILFVIFFQIGPGAIPWFITAELFRESARASAISIAGLVNWSSNFVVGISYLPLENLIGGYTFVIFTVLLALFWLFTYFKVPETKGRSIVEIHNYFV